MFLVVLSAFTNQVSCCRNLHLLVRDCNFLHIPQVLLESSLLEPLLPREVSCLVGEESGLKQTHQDVADGGQGGGIN